MISFLHSCDPKLLVKNIFSWANVVQVIYFGANLLLSTVVFVQDKSLDSRESQSSLECTDNLGTAVDSYQIWLFEEYCSYLHISCMFHLTTMMCKLLLVQGLTKKNTMVDHSWICSRIYISTGSLSVPVRIPSTAAVISTPFQSSSPSTSQAAITGLVGVLDGVHFVHNVCALSLFGVQWCLLYAQCTVVWYKISQCYFDASLCLASHTFWSSYKGYALSNSIHDRDIAKVDTNSTNWCVILLPGVCLAESKLAIQLLNMWLVPSCAESQLWCIILPATLQQLQIILDIAATTSHSFVPQDWYFVWVFQLK